MSSEIPLLSIVIPAYNASATLSRALGSVEPLDSVEVVVVDDGSTDATASIAASFADRLALRIISLERNGGASAAWNEGIKASRGTFVTRLDADDILGPVSPAIPLLTDSTDILWGRVESLKNGKRRLLKRPESADLNDQPICVDSFSLWGKAIRRSLLSEPDMECFPGIDCWDDLGVVARLLARRPRVEFTDSLTYTYILQPHGQSLSTSSRQRLLNDHLATARLLEQRFIADGIADRYAEFLNHLKFAAKVKLLRHRDRDVAAWKSTFPEVNCLIMGLRHVALRHRLMFAAVASLPTKPVQLIANLFDSQESLT